ncbi:hypothetical protein HYU08_01345 [Candidatus Woesearchaeota archaeon]|nr:hypothetical protein [Candidatus Woesearchaeota archaeon]
MAKKAAKKSKVASKKLPEPDDDDDDELELHPAEEQGILPEETSEEHELAIDLGEEDEDIYTDEGRKKLEENDEIEPWEEGLMEGASELGQLGKDALTGVPLMGADEVIEMELDGKMYRFVSEKNAEKFRDKMTKKKVKGKNKD